MKGRPPRRSDSLSLAEARRIAIAAQGFDGTRSTEPASRTDLRRLVDRLGVLQIDSVNVLTRAHTLPAFSRLGHYDRGDLDTLTYNGRRRALFEYWGHAASLLPVALYPLLRWRMDRAAQGVGIYRSLATFGRERRTLIDGIRREIADRGPLAAQELTQKEKGSGGWWGWSESKAALEWLFWAGIVTTETRRATFERVYDLTERVLPAAVLDAPMPDAASAQRALIERSARALGIASELCLRDYYRLTGAEARPAIADLIDAGTLRPVTVEGWDRPAYLHTGARTPRSLDARALLAPFDPLIWQRARTESLFGARIRLELYTPEAKRTHGYYVLPFLLGDRIAARVDLKADRAASTLRVLAAHAESGVPIASFAEPLAAELRLMAQWLGLERTTVARRGDASAALKSHLK